MNLSSIELCFQSNCSKFGYLGLSNSPQFYWPILFKDWSMQGLRVYSWFPDRLYNWTRSCRLPFRKRWGFEQGLRFVIVDGWVVLTIEQPDWSGVPTSLIAYLPLLYQLLSQGFPIKQTKQSTKTINFREDLCCLHKLSSPTETSSALLKYTCSISIWRRNS